MLQRAIRYCGALDATNDDGVYGSDTVRALKAEQSWGGLTGNQVDGPYGPTTHNVIEFYGENGKIGGCAKDPVRIP
jgi:peptidoglycan hydrolase-like protein with peptidoglycan-binding domain